MKFETYTLKDLAIIKYGKNQKKVLSESGSVPIFGTGGFMGYATESLYDKPSVLIGRKGTIDKVRYIDSIYANASFKSASIRPPSGMKKHLKF
jgi:type I restriction enzyme S subunit